MFGSSKPVVFDPYRRRRAGARVPRWLVLLLLGAAAGAGTVLYVQMRVLPPRLSMDESAALQRALADADAERARLKADLQQATQRLQAATATQQRAQADAAAQRSAAQGLRADLAALVAALPPDPRGGAVEVRSGRFSAEGGQLAWDVVLTRARAGGKPLDGVMHLRVDGVQAGGREARIALQPVALSVGAHEVVRGSAPLPAGFTPRSTTVQVLDRAAGRPLGMRVLLVK